MICFFLSTLCLVTGVCCSLFCQNHWFGEVLLDREGRASQRSIAQEYSETFVHKADVFANFMYQSHFLVAFIFVGTDFNCFLKSIRRSIPMTVAVKLTRTRRCMTCSFFVTFFYVYRERDLAVCAAVIVLLSERFDETRQRFRTHSAHSWSYFGSHSANIHSNNEFYGRNQLLLCDDYILLPVAGVRGPGRPVRGFGERSRCGGMNGLWNINYCRGRSQRVVTIMYTHQSFSQLYVGTSLSVTKNRALLFSHGHGAHNGSGSHLTCY